METVGNTGLWLVFAAIVVGMLALDLFVLKGGHQHRVSLKEAVAWSLAWVTVALLFNLGLWWYLSIPAVFAITNDPFIVLTSNLFAILGLRAMYFLLADIGDRFAMLKYGLAIILVFIGIKMLIVDWYKIPVMVSLATVGTILLVSVIVSLWHNKRFPPHSHS